MLIIDIIKGTLGFFCKEPLRQLRTDRIMGYEVKALLEKSPAWDSNASFKMADSSYKLVEMPVLKAFLRGNSVNSYVYEKDSFDCDDFSFALMGDVTKWDSDLAFGIIWVTTPNSTGHALNWCVDVNRKLWFVEPQNNKIFEITEDYKVRWCVA